MDINVSGKSEEELHKISERMVIVIYNDIRVIVSNGNKIKDLNIASSIE